MNFIKQKYEELYHLSHIFIIVHQLYNINITYQIYNKQYKKAKKYEDLYEEELMKYRKTIDEFENSEKYKTIPPIPKKLNPSSVIKKRQQ